MVNQKSRTLESHFDELFDEGWRIVPQERFFYNVEEVRSDKSEDKLNAFRKLELQVEKNHYLVSKAGIRYPICAEKIKEPNSELDYQFYDDWCLANDLIKEINSLEIPQKIEFYQRYLVKVNPKVIDKE